VSDGRERFHFTAELWRWPGSDGAGTWHFLRIAGEVAEAISELALMRRLEHGKRRGWGSLKVEARIGDTEWATSIFPEKDKTWLLPVKKSVRSAEGLAADDTAQVEITL
jgi:hypothetical protein